MRNDFTPPRWPDSFELHSGEVGLRNKGAAFWCCSAGHFLAKQDEAEGKNTFVTIP